MCPSFLAEARKSLRCKEAPVGIEPTNRGFSDLCLTTWLRRRTRYTVTDFKAFLRLGCKPLPHDLATAPRARKCLERWTFSTHHQRPVPLWHFCGHFVGFPKGSEH